MHAESRNIVSHFYLLLKTLVWRDFIMQRSLCGELSLCLDHFDDLFVKKKIVAYRILVQNNFTIQRYILSSIKILPILYNNNNVGELRVQRMQRDTHNNIGGQLCAEKFVFIVQRDFLRRYFILQRVFIVRIFFCTSHNLQSINQRYQKYEDMDYLILK